VWHFPEQKHIFEEFHQVDNFRRQKGGTGLIAISKRFVVCTTGAFNESQTESSAFSFSCPSTAAH
jgi:signal transduction histidine kinase